MCPLSIIFEAANSRDTAVYKNPNFNPFQSSSVLPIRGSCCICCVILTLLNVLSGYFYVSFNLTSILYKLMILWPSTK